MPTYAVIIFNHQDGKRDQNICASLYQPLQRFRRIRLSEEDKDHNGMTKNLDPPLKGSEGNIRPKNGEKTVKKERD